MGIEMSVQYTVQTWHFHLLCVENICTYLFDWETTDIYTFFLRLTLLALDICKYGCSLGLSL
jgi:hypothetical protein